jgi:hypothetical protein
MALMVMTLIKRSHSFMVKKKKEKCLQEFEMQENPKVMW